MKRCALCRKRVRSRLPVCRDCRMTSKAIKRFPELTAPVAGRPKCSHCKVRNALTNKRGLCWVCFKNPSAIAKLPAVRRRNDEAEAKLDALIESRRATMPPNGNQPRDRPKHYTIPIIRALYRHNGLIVRG